MDPFMYKAAACGDVHFLQKIRDGEEPADLLNHQTPKGNNVLHLAAEFKKINFFEDVPLDKRSPLFWAINKMGDTPMHIAARVGCDEVVDFLIEHAKMLHVRRTIDWEKGPTYPESYKMLLRKTNLEMHTALHVAARYGHRKVVNSLMKADPKLCSSANSTKESPLFLATCEGFSNIARDILYESSISPSFRGINGVTALHAAVTHKYPGAEGIVEVMVSKYPNKIKKVDALGWTPLHYAAFRGNHEATRLLMQWDKSSSCYILDKSGMSALHIAAYAGHIEVMKVLIQSRPDTCECLNVKGQTILHVAVLGEHSKVVEYMVKIPELRRLIHQVDRNGNTPLHLAVISQNDEIVRILSLDCRVNNATIDKEFSLLFNNFLGDDIEVQEIIDNKYQGSSYGVALFQQEVGRHLEKLEYYPKVVDERQKIKSNETNLLMATLLATVTFSASLAPPGGYGSDGKFVLIGNTFFTIFRACNMMSFFLSIMVLIYESYMAYFGYRIIALRTGSLIIGSLYAMMFACFTGTAGMESTRVTIKRADAWSLLVVMIFTLIVIVLHYLPTIARNLQARRRRKPVSRINKH